MSTITEISANIAHDVANIPKIGTQDKLYLITETDFQDNLTTTVTANQITAITGTNVAFKWEGANSSVNFSVEKVTVGQHYAFRHSLTLEVFDKNATNLAQIDALTQSGKVRAIVETNGGPDCGGLFWFLGWCSGLSVADGTLWDQSSTDNPGWTLTLSTPEDGSPESKAAYEVFVTDYAGTLTAVDALV